ncbi:putative FeS-containing Cyanobacterial-specific oxidoreductase [[Clostridium] ultunense Esp]|uniref:Putative FeS-containing Cyanobacterial-specific oxidoreductase n=1 Tax=[Clostridium] ultunense Esp TaxID=1288971 RepID=M1ZC02_9FIRM|nr:DUF512 domain-containing protein [Schnuerera ultunensis]CCQ96021.1 putative FeS-containing Cyanobacterial-specific oxidoreductase [[Clostridium] ultunense Esp]SHD76913.1 putative FeS-containing Cyanobacterial-specific oxidoreductase [[Clostridium] ultunense Esp]
MELKKIYDYRNIVERVLKGSIAEEMGIEPKDILLSINGQKVKDIIDYKYLISDDYVEVEIEKKDGEVWILEIEKNYDEDLGIEFTNPLIDKARSCRNKCIFCFIDQLPPNMRETLYFKDDDSRLSFLQGNFITLTNMNDEDIDRIIKYRLSPINISVHTTNPELRVKMLNNKNAGKILSILQRFKEADIKVNCQIVLVPQINDGKELERTLTDLSSLYPSVESVAVVPVGLTRYRDNLHRIIPFNKESALGILNLIRNEQNKLKNEIGTRFVFASDEFYALTDEPLPNYEEYEGFPQLENGVGLLKTFEHSIDGELDKIDEKFFSNKKYIIATGTLAEGFMNRIKNKIMEKFIGLELKVVAIENKFFGRSITVSGLITGQDIVSQLKGYKYIDGIIIPKSMLRAESNIFLDDLTIEDIEKRLKVKIIPVEVSGKDFVNLFKRN